MAEAGMERPEDAGKDNVGLARYWKTELDLAHKAEATWRKRGWQAVTRYRDDKQRAKKRFNIFWANVETLKPVIYSNTPEPDIRRRYMDADPVGREAAEVLERCISATIDGGGFDCVMESVRDDLLIPGRGVAWVRLESEIVRRIPEKQVITSLMHTDVFGGEPVMAPVDRDVYMLDGMQVEPDGEDNGEAYIEQVSDQSVEVDYVFWEDFRIFPAGARSWYDVYGVGRKHVLTRDELEEMFGTEVGRRIPLNYNASVVDDKQDDAKKKDTEPLMRACVWEIWDKRTKERLYVAEGFDEVVERGEAPLDLEGFFPCPEPLYAMKTTDTMVPQPELFIYRDQADELDNITYRIDRLIAALKVRGLYASVIKEFRDLLKGDDNEIYPAADWAALEDKGGLEKAVAFLPIERIAQVLQGLYQQRDTLRQEIFEITGLSDLIRGSTAASETATAQELKGRFGQIRMSPRQRPVQRFIRDLFRIMAEIMAEHFTPETFQQMTGRQVSEEVMAMLRDERTRGFRIDIETDTTVQPDAESERKQTVEFVSSVTGYLQTAGELAAAQPALAPMLMEMLKFAVRRFKTGRSLEEAIDQTAQQIQQMAQQPQQQDQSGQMEAQALAQAKMQEAQANIQIKAQEAEMAQKLKMIEQRQEFILRQMGLEQEAELTMREQDINASLKAREQALMTANATG